MLTLIGKVTWRAQAWDTRIKLYARQGGMYTNEVPSLFRSWLSADGSKATLKKRGLRTVPESLRNIPSLTILDLSCNELTALPDWLGDLNTLVHLDLHANLLTTLPESIGNLTSLTTLELTGNQLTALPESIGNLTGLTELNLLYQRLTTLPRSLADRLSDGLYLELDGNPLVDPLPEILNRGANAVATYLRSLEDAIPQYEAKLLLVGEGNVGKTSLVAALMGAPFVEDRPTTHGIEISTLTFRHPDLEEAMRLRAWDFGGQEVYRVTHQFFFSRRALYLVVWNARQGAEQDQVEDWLRRIRLRTGQEAFSIVVATHCDDRLPELDYPRLKQEFPGMLVGSFEVDSRTGTGLTELHKAIGRQAAKLSPVGQMISPRWLAARDAIVACAKTEPQIQYEQFAEICKFHEVTDSEIVTFAELLHDLGHIIYYGDDEGLKDIVVLNPEWLTKAISYILEDKVTRDQGGVLDHARLRSIWCKGPDGKAYPPRYHKYFLRLMEKFDVSYRLDGDELHSLVAQLVPHQRPNLPWQSRTVPPTGVRTLALACRLSEPVPGLIPWLTVRHHRASTGLHWRRGVLLRHPIDAYDSEALLELRHDTELALEVRAPSPDLYFNVLRDSIEDLITSRWPGLSYKLLIPCPVIGANGSLCAGQFSLDALLRWRQSGIAETPCPECARVHEISRLITGFTMSGSPLATQLDQVYIRLHEQLNRIEGHAAEAGDSLRRVLRVVSAEVKDCPRLFTLALERPARGRRLRVDQKYYRLTLWCEHPGHWHPWLPASYELNQPKEWLTRVSPYVNLILRSLKLVVPPAGSLATTLLSPDQLAHAQANLQLMNSVVASLPTELAMDNFDVDQTVGQLTPAEGQALRGIRAVLFEHDRLQAFGGMRRVQAPSGDLLWVCVDHYVEYDPGLPIVP